MKDNRTYPLGGIVMIEKVEKEFGFFAKVFKGVEGNARDFIPLVEYLVHNKLTYSVSIHQMLEVYPEELTRQLGMKRIPSERTLYRTLERVGRGFPVLHERYQQFVRENKLEDSKQFMDFSSTYVEGEKAELAEFGYSRDKRPDRKQINFGISTGINGIPTALTIQRGNTQDKKHLRELLKLVSKVIPENSLLIFDAGANSGGNKKRIRGLRYHYLTLKPKKVGTYKKYLNFFNEQLKKGNAEYIELNHRHYSCVKKLEKDESTAYIFFSPDLYLTQLRAKERKFKRGKERGKKLLKRRKPERIPSKWGWVELIPHLQHTFFTLDNPYINGIEGFFILESSVDEGPEKILKLYKERDKAEKFFRALKEGIELRPLRHWNKWSIIGVFFISFLANLLINLTLFLNKNSPIKQAKLLKKFLINLTLTVVYPEKGFRFHVLSNVSPQILGIFGDFVWKFEDKSLNLRW
jgi:transposase